MWNTVSKHAVTAVVYAALQRASLSLTSAHVTEAMTLRGCPATVHFSV